MPFMRQKNLLFMETADYCGDQILKVIMQEMPTNPTKYDSADAMKMLMDELNRNKWMLSMHQDYELFMRKLPPGLLGKESAQRFDRYYRNRQEV